MVNKPILKFWPGPLIIFIVLLFNVRLFLPKISMYTTPDFGRSDFVNFNIPMKFVLKESLKTFSLPLWEKNIGQGYPVFAEGQVGALYPPNFILFSTLPLWMAFNLSIITMFLTAAFGTYFLSRSLSLSRSGSLLASITYTFSPIIVLHVQHLNLAQTAAIFPWQLLVINIFFVKKEVKYLVYFAVLTSLQIFAGFQQIVAYSLLGISAFSLFKMFGIKSSLHRVKIIASILAFLILAVAIAFIQLTATYELSKESQRSQTTTPKSILSDFPFKPVNLKTIINPYIQGSPKNGTYPPFILGSWGIFWENNAYFGIVQLALIMLSAIFLIFRNNNRNNRQMVIFLFGLGILGILLALGKEAPFHVLFSLPPFSFFRVPSRFLFITFLSAAILAGFSLDKIRFLKNKNCLNFMLTAIIIIAAFDIFRVWFRYNLTENVTKLETAPTLRKNINNDGRLLSYGLEEEWSTKYFVKEGWENNPEIYLFFRNAFAQNSNLLYGISQHAAYAGMSSKRSAIAMVTASEFITSEDNMITIGEKSQKLLNANNVKYLTTTKTLDSDKWRLLNSVNSYNTTINLYKNSDASPRVFIPSGYTVATTNNEFRTILENGTDISKTVVLEEKVDISNNELENTGSAQITQDDNNIVKIYADLKEKSLVVLSDSFYPGWKVYIDGQESKIYPTNVNSRSVVVPAGQHQILYKYDSQTIKTGGLVSGIALIITFLLISIPKSRNYRLNN